MKLNILTVAYNAEKTIKRSIESVINQSSPNWKYYLVDNGSLDSTYSIMKEYESVENIIIKHIEQNDIKNAFKMINEIVKNESSDDLLCTLDSDDELTDIFAETVLNEMQAQDIDLVALGTEMYSTSNGTLLKRVVIDNRLMIDDQNIANFFPNIHWFLRQIWGKAFRLSVLRKYDIQHPDIPYGADTVFTMDYVANSSKYVFIPTIGMKYYYFNGSSSYIYKDGREISDLLLYQKALSTVSAKCDRLPYSTIDFMNNVYLHAIIDSLKVLINSDFNLANKLQLTISIFKMFEENTISISQNLSEEYNNLKKNTFHAYISLINEHPDLFNKDNCPEIQKFVLFYNSQLNFWFSDEFDWWLRNYAPLIEKIAFKEYQLLFNMLIKNKDAILLYPNATKQHLLMLLQKLAATLEREEDYIFFSLELIWTKIKLNDLAYAESELAEWQSLLPNNKRVKELSLLLSNQQQLGK